MSEETLDPPMRIADVERDTGIGKDTLRVWERRYDFPKPMRDALGERLYPGDQIERLRVIRRLLDRGMRPGKVLALDLPGLHRLMDGYSVDEENSDRHALCIGLIRLLRMHRSRELRENLNRILVRDGLQRFISETIVPMNRIIGDFWIRGELSVPEEHVYTELVQNVIRHAIHSQSTGDQHPRILLATFPDEEHCLGILMVEAMCISEGAQCTSLGTRIPLADIAKYANDGIYDVVAISFSAAYPSRSVVKDLKQFRELLPPSISIWAGGSGLNQKRLELSQMKILTNIEGIPSLVNEWRQQSRSDL